MLREYSGEAGCDSRSNPSDSSEDLPHYGNPELVSNVPHTARKGPSEVCSNVTVNVCSDWIPTPGLDPSDVAELVIRNV